MIPDRQHDTRPDCRSRAPAAITRVSAVLSCESLLHWCAGAAICAAGTLSSGPRLPSRGGMRHETHSSLAGRCGCTGLTVGFVLAGNSAEQTSPSSTAAATTTTVAATSTTVESTTTSEAMMPMTDIASAGGAHFEIAGALDWLLVVEGVAWAMGDAPVTRIDASGNVLSTTKLPGSVCLAPDQGFGSVWAATCGTPESCPAGCGDRGHPGDRFATRRGCSCLRTASA